MIDATGTADTDRHISQSLDARKVELAEAITNRQFAMDPGLGLRYGEPGKAKCREDALRHLAYLSEAVASGQPSLFADYIGWAKVLLASLNIPGEDLTRNLECMRDVLREGLPPDAHSPVIEYVEAGLNQLPQLPSILPSYLDGDWPLADLARQYLDALLKCRRDAASRLILDAVAAGVPVRDIYLSVFQSSQYEIGRLWQSNQISVAQEHYCTAATQLIMSQLYPHIFSTEKNGRRMVAACVSGDLHEIGVRMVADFFEMAGWDTFYLGASTPTGSIVGEVIERKVDIVGISATLTSHIRGVAEVIEAVRSAGECRGVKVLVGGYPFNIAPGLWRQVGADLYARNADEAIDLAGQLDRREAHDERTRRG